jgi:hypothetical protein
VSAPNEVTASDESRPSLIEIILRSPQASTP